MKPLQRQTSLGRTTSEEISLRPNTLSKTGGSDRISITGNASHKLLTRTRQLSPPKSTEMSKPILPKVPSKTNTTLEDIGSGSSSVPTMNISRDELKRKIKSSVEEFYQIGDVNEMINSIQVKLPYS